MHPHVTPCTLSNQGFSEDHLCPGQNARPSTAKTNVITPVGIMFAAHLSLYCGKKAEEDERHTDTD